MSMYVLSKYVEVEDNVCFPTMVVGFEMVFNTFLGM